ncbi:MAG: hypothetical protein GXP24_01815 [Planctomycetes bacterium]|nr:hypothetical protein [Planctomycetota bacterium]
MTTLLIVMTVVALWLGRTTFLTRKQEKAIQIISATEGAVIESEDSGPPDWLRTTVGEEYFRKITAVDFATNMGRRKDGGEPKVTDKALAQLKSLPGLEVLELSHNETVTDAQLAYLSPLKDLKTIYLFRTQIRGPGLIHLVGLRHLKAIQLGGTKLNDAGLEHLAKIKGLKYLGLNDTEITDLGVAHLAELRNLERIDLNNTDITDKSMASLGKLEKLKELGLTGTKITAEGARQIKLALPNCMVICSFALGKTVDETPLFPVGKKPSATEINAEFKSRSIDGHVSTDSSMSGNPIVTLYLSRTTLSDEGVLDIIKVLPQLKALIVRRALVGNRLLEGIPSMQQLYYLELTETNVTVDGLQHLLELPNLRELYLKKMVITDQDLETFPLLYGLQLLSLEGANLSKEAIENLRERLPGCMITY